MRIAMSSYSGYGAWFIMRLIAEGHKVDYYLSESKYQDVLEYLIPKPICRKMDHRLSTFSNHNYPDYSKYDLSLFDLTGRKRQADYSNDCCPTIGDGSFHVFLENDRVGGIKLMEKCGINVPPYKEFSELGAAKAFIKKTGKRYVYKPNGGQDQDAATTYVSKSSDDLLEYIDKIYELSKRTPFVLQEFVKGTEISCEGWFNGHDFYLLNCTLEDKKFMSGNYGPNTGCAGNIVFTINSQSRIFTEGLAKTKDMLKAAGFRGMIDLNTIATENAIYGLEWTPRFGYDASATMACMYNGNYGEMLASIATGKVPEESWNSTFGVSARISIPPYPTELKMAKNAGVPIKGIDPDNVKELLSNYLFDVKLENKHLICAGNTGFLAAPIEVGNDLGGIWSKLESRIKKFDIPDMQYRDDIGKSTTTRYRELQKMDWF